MRSCIGLTERSLRQIEDFELFGQGARPSNRLTHSQSFKHQSDKTEIDFSGSIAECPLAIFE